MTFHQSRSTDVEAFQRCVQELERKIDNQNSRPSWIRRFAIAWKPGISILNGTNSRGFFSQSNGGNAQAWLAFDTEVSGEQGSLFIADQVACKIVDSKFRISRAYEPFGPSGGWATIAMIETDCVTGANVLEASNLTLNSAPTTSSTANAYVDPATGQVKRSTSSAKYKTDIEPAKINTADVLALEARTWHDKADVVEATETKTEPQRYVGFVAEELDALPTMRQFVDYLDGEPESVNYDRLSVALLELAKVQQRRLDDMDARLSALEKKA